MENLAKCPLLLGKTHIAHTWCIQHEIDLIVLIVVCWIDENLDCLCKQKSGPKLWLPGTNKWYDNIFNNIILIIHVCSSFIIVATDIANAIFIWLRQRISKKNAEHHHPHAHFFPEWHHRRHHHLIRARVSHHHWIENIAHVSPHNQTVNLISNYSVIPLFISSLHSFFSCRPRRDPRWQQRN